MKIIISFVLTLFIVSCTQKNTEKSSVDETFQVFLNKFNNDSIFQKSRVKFPLSVVEMDNENYSEVKRRIKRKDYIIIDLKEDRVIQKREGYTQKIELKNDKATIEIRGIENGIMEDYYFEKINSKWILVGWNDSST